MRTKYYFISDVHLGLKSHDEEKQKESRLVSFLDSIKDEAAKLFILGDLFDCWIEYRKVVPKGYYRTLAKLNEFTEAGIRITEKVAGLAGLVLGKLTNIAIDTGIVVQRELHEVTALASGAKRAAEVATKIYDQLAILGYSPKETIETAYTAGIIAFGERYARKKGDTTITELFANF